MRDAILQDGMPQQTLPCMFDTFINARCYSAGWNAAADVAKRALIAFKTPTKRGGVSDLLTIHQVCSTLVMNSFTVQYQ